MTRAETIRAAYASQQSLTGAPRVSLWRPRVDWTLAYALTVGGAACGLVIGLAWSMWF